MPDCDVDTLIELVFTRKIHHRDAGFYVLFASHGIVDAELQRPTDAGRR
jgi:hypothetical protein